MFFLLSFPAGFKCFSVFLGDSGDGFQNVWNIWWVKEAVFRLHENPLYTRYLFFPEGVSLLGHTVSLTNTLPAAALALAIGVVPAYNVWLIMGFVLGGVFTTYLFLEVGTGVWGAFAAGFVYTFSEYHFGHSLGHFQLIPVEWIPLFLWAWLRMLETPSLKRALLAAVALVLVFFTDYYYVLFAIFAGAIALGWRMAEKRDGRIWFSLGLFVLVVAAAAGPTAWQTAKFLNAPMTGVHNPFEFEVDVLAPLVPGAFWKFGNLTQPVWKTFTTPPVEGCAYFGWAAMVLAAMGTWRWRKSLGWKIWFLLSTGALFFLLSLGPQMRVAGVPIRGIWGLYHHVENLLPLLRSGGVPSRMVLMSILCVALLAGLGVEALRKGRRYGVLAGLLLVGFVEAIPSPMKITSIEVPRFFEAMKNLPKGYGVLDRSSGSLSVRMYYQTHFELPTSGGYISREPVAATEREVRVQAMAARGEWQSLCQGLGFRYVLFSGSGSMPGRAPVLEGDGYRLFDLDSGWGCKRAFPAGR
jgi:hypothetical protein